MDILGRLSIRTRLYFGTVFSLVLLIVIGGLGYLALDRTRDTLQVLFSERVQTLTDMADLRTTLGTLRRTEKDIILNFNNSVEVAAQRETWARTLAALRKSLTAVRQVQAGDPAFAGSIDKALAEIQQYEAGISPIFEQIERAQLDGAGGAAYADRLKSHMETTDQILASLAQSARENMEEARQGVEARTATMSAVIGGGLVLALAVLIPLTFFSVRSITGSLAQARSLAERIAGGDLSHEVRPAQMDEVGQLVVAMGRMQDALRGLVRQVQDASGSISTASTEIASGNHDLSHRTEQTAANLEETASSMEMLAGTVQQSTQSARQASDFASTAAQVAAKGGSVVSQVVDTMGQITDSSRRIADITGVIDSIAFQTNILALNAAVEAARAGEQGPRLRGGRGRGADAGPALGLGGQGNQGAHRLLGGARGKRLAPREPGRRDHDRDRGQRAPRLRNDHGDHRLVGRAERQHRPDQPVREPARPDDPAERRAGGAVHGRIGVAAGAGGATDWRRAPVPPRRRSGGGHRPAGTAPAWCRLPGATAPGRRPARAGVRIRAPRTCRLSGTPDRTVPAVFPAVAGGA